MAMTDVKREAIVPFSPAQMYALVNDIAAYPEFLPWCSASQILEENEDEIRASIDVAAVGFSKSFTTHNRLQKDKMIEIRLLDGPFKHLEGFWRFDAAEEAGNTEQTRIALDLEFELAGQLLDFAFGAVFHQVASTMVDAFCERAKAVYATS